MKFHYEIVPHYAEIPLSAYEAIHCHGEQQICFDGESTRSHKDTAFNLYLEHHGIQWTKLLDLF